MNLTFFNFNNKNEEKINNIVFNFVEFMSNITKINIISNVSSKFINFKNKKSTKNSINVYWNNIINKSENQEDVLIFFFDVLDFSELNLFSILNLTKINDYKNYLIIPYFLKESHLNFYYYEYLKSKLNKKNLVKLLNLTKPINNQILSNILEKIQKI